MLEPVAGATGVSELTPTANGLHWRRGFGIQRLGEDGASVETVVMDKASDPIASNGNTLAWIGNLDDKHGVLTLPLGSSAMSPTFVAPTSSFVTSLLLDDTHAYYGGSASDGIVRAPLSPGEPVRIAMPFGVQAMQIEGSHVYFVEQLGDHLMRVPVTGGEPEQVTPPGDIGTFVMDATHFYTSGNGGIARVQRSDQTRAMLLRHKTASGAISNSVSKLIDDGDRLVFADRLNNIGWVMKDGSDCSYIATTTTTASPAVYQTEIALDAQHLYVAAERALHRVSRSAVGLD